MKYFLTSLGRVTQATCDIHFLFISLLFFFHPHMQSLHRSENFLRLQYIYCDINTMLTHWKNPSGPKRRKGGRVSEAGWEDGRTEKMENSLNFPRNTQWSQVGSVYVLSHSHTFLSLSSFHSRRSHRTYFWPYR